MSDKIELGQVVDPSKSSDSMDAVHVPIRLVKATARVFPGQEFRTESGQVYAVADPFLKRPVMPDEFYWQMMAPGTVRKLRHVWEYLQAETKTPKPCIAPEEGLVSTQDASRAQYEFDQEQDDAICRSMGCD